jgi:hypothetical protein
MVAIGEDRYTFMVASHRYGFVDREFHGFGREWSDTVVELGPLGVHRVPFSATVGWLLVAVMLLAIFTSLIVAAISVRRFRRRPPT